MASIVEIFRRGELGKGDPFYLHPMNQALVKDVMAKRRKGRNLKAEKAEARRRRQEQYLEDDLPRFQFNRALGHIVDNNGGTAEDVSFVLGHMSFFEREVERFTLGESTVTITVVDLVNKVP